MESVLDLKGTGSVKCMSGDTLTESVLFIITILEESMKSENYVVIQGWMIKELGLKGNELLVYALIYGFSQTEGQKFTGSLQYLEDWCNSSRQGIIKCLQSLQQKQLIIKKDLAYNKATYEINPNSTWSTKFTTMVNKVDHDGKQSLPNNIDNNLTKKSLLDKSNKDYVKTDSKVLIETFINMYNSMCTNLPKCIKSTPKRDKAILNIVNKFNSYQIQECFTSANNSDFLTGKNDTGWKANIDFFLREDKFVNILEGMYGGKQKVSSKIGTDVGLNLNRVADKQQIREDIQNGKAEKF